jgi:hypothetical protein
MSGEVRLEQVSVSAREEDVSTLDGILSAFYDVISGPGGAPRDWHRDRTLYAPGALFVPSGMNDSNRFAVVMDHEAYIKRSDPVFAEGFYEREIHRVTHTFGNVTHVFSTYEARWTPDGPVIVRGVNSMELVYAGNRWWIIAALWDTERPDNPIPPELLPD